MLNNENAHCFINYVMSGHTITDEIIEKLNYDDLLQHANELGEYTKENLMKFIRYIKSLLNENEQSFLSLHCYERRFNYYKQNGN